MERLGCRELLLSLNSFLFVCGVVNLLETSEIPLTPTTWVACLETVIAGHEQWVYGLRWHPSLRIPRPTSTPIVPESLFDVIPSEDESDAEKSSSAFLSVVRRSDFSRCILSDSVPICELRHV